MTRYIKIRIECVLPVPAEVTDDLDAVAESGLAAMRDLIAANVTTLVPGTLASSWQSMPQSWQPKKSNIILAEEVAPGFTHTIDTEERIGFVEDPTIMHPWDQDLWIFPTDHPLRGVEAKYRTQYVEYLGRYPHLAQTKKALMDKAVLELEAGDEDE